jgi:Undecaprenyl-phosphate glucose phosphotransferase
VVQANGALALGKQRRRSRLSPSARSALIEGATRAADLVIVAGAGLAAGSARFIEPAQFDSNAPASLVGLLIALQVFTFWGNYRPVDLGRWCSIRRMLSLWIMIVLCLLAYLFATKSSDQVSRLWLGYWACIAGIGIVGVRLVVRILLIAFTDGSVLHRRVLIIAESQELAHRVVSQQQEDGGNIVVGILVLSDWGHVQTASSISVTIPHLIQRHGADRVIIVAGWTQANVVESVLAPLRHCPVEVLWVPSLVSVCLPLIEIARNGNQVALRVLEPPLDGWLCIIKTVEDRLLAVLLLVVLAPWMLLISATVKLTSPGPILFRQQRYGFNREVIEVLKFRTMHAFACDARDASTVEQVARRDPRVTPVGRFLRRSSLDELPQLINVLRGEMSLVGPRPHAVAHDSYYESLIENYLQRHCVKPGITGWAQIHGCRGPVGTVEDMKQRVAFDLEYIQRWTPVMDFWILIRTPISLVVDKNAY